MLKNVKSCKFAMTLAEILVIFVIMGVIATLIIVTARPGDKSLKYVYYRMYNSLETALYNSSIDMNETLRKDIYDTNNDYLEGGGVIQDNDKQFPSKPSQLCEMLLEYINQKGTTNNCTAADDKDTLINVNNPDFSIQPHFIASNGTKVWMGYDGNDELEPYFYSKNVTKIYDKTSADMVDTDSRFAYVFIDLNGDMGPNSPVQVGDNLADIAAFAITSGLDVIPLGAPITDTRYFSASVVYANKAAKDADHLVTSSQMSFLQAKKLAWGSDDKKEINTQDWNEPLTLNNLGLSCTSPFYVGYTKANDGYCESIPNGIDLSTYSDITNQTIDNDCTTEKSGTKLPDTEACYLEIKDYY